jgi:LysM repeat protein
MKRLFFGFALICTLLNGCAMQEMATKDEISQVQGNLSEEVITVKRSVSQVQMELDDALQRSQSLQQTMNSNQAALASRLESLENRLLALEEKIESIESHSKNAESKLQQSLQNQTKEMEMKRSADLDKMEQKLNIILEEVSKENERILAELHSARPISSQAGDGFHVVQPGESLSRIASRYGLSPSALAQANNLTNPNSIRAGQKLKIPKK